MSSPEPGWYPDPADPGRLARWWDGEEWTDRTRARQAGHGATEPTADETSEPAGPTSAGALPGAPALSGVPRTRHTGVVVITVVLALALAVVAVAATTHRMVNPSAVPSSAEPPAAGQGGLDVATKTVTLEGVRLTLPDAPYHLDTRPIAIDGLFVACYTANALVHPGYDGDHDWVSTVALASLPAATDTTGLARNTLAGVHDHFFGGHPLRPGPVTETWGELDGHKTLQLTQDVDYTIPGLPSTGDRITVVVVKLSLKRHVAAVSVVPHDAPGPVRAAATDSMTSLRVG